MWLDLLRPIAALAEVQLLSKRCMELPQQREGGVGGVVNGSSLTHPQCR